MNIINNTTNPFDEVIFAHNDLVMSIAGVKNVETMCDNIAEKTAEVTKEYIEEGADPTEATLDGLRACRSTEFICFKPDMKALIAAVVQTAEDGNMCHMREYQQETGNKIPKDMWDYIYSLVK